MTRRKQWAVVCTGGDGPERESVESLMSGRTKTVAADSGADLADDLGISPDMFVGDMDSISSERLLSDVAADRVLRFEHEKDETDTEIALRILNDEGFENIAIVGGGGGRLDHLIAILSLFARDVRPTLWVTRDDFVLSIEKDFVLEGYQEHQISFFPVGTDICRASSIGLQWNLDDLEWKCGDVGVSNRIVGERMSVTLRSGRLLMVGEIKMLPGILS